VNHKIRVPEVRLVGPEGEQLGVFATKDAMGKARQYEMDLVEIAPTSRPPVCKIMDYGKFKYEQGKKQKVSKKHQAQTKVKEIKYHANVGEHDYQTKLRRTRDFLMEGYRVKCSLYFRGRENDHRQFGFDLFQRVKADVAELVNVDQEPRLTGRNLMMLLSPNDKTRAKAKEEAGKKARKERNSNRSEKSTKADSESA